MTSRERFLTTLAGGKPDRVPVCLFIADQGHYINQLYPDIDPFDFESMQMKIVEYQRELGCDILLRLLYGLNDPLSIHTGGLNVSRSTDTWEVSTEVEKRGTVTVEKSRIRTPAGDLTQEYSVNEIRPGTFVYAPTKKPIASPEDLEIARKYEPGMPDDWPDQVKRMISNFKQAVGDDGIVGSWTPHGPFNNASLLFNHEELYMLYLTDYGFYKELMTFAMERILDYTAAIDAAGVDLHCVGGNVAGGFLGKKTFDEYILPFEKTYIEFVQKNGTPAMYHNCGEIMNLVDSYKDLGVAAVEPFSPPPLGDCADLGAAMKQVAGDYAVLSGVNQVGVIQKGTVEEVREVTRKTMEVGKASGYPFIMQNIDFLEYGTPPENVEAFVKTALEYA